MSVAGKVFSYLISVIFTVLISKFGQKLVWGNKKEDGSYKQPWPPSPKGLPYLTGGLASFQQDSYRALTRWYNELKSPIYSVQLGFKRIIVLNSAELVHQALIEKDQFNSSRSTCDTLERSWTDQAKTVFSAPFSLYWSRLRRAIYIVIGPLYLGQFSQFFQSQARKLSIGISESLTGEKVRLERDEVRQLVDLVALDSALTLVLGSDVEREPAELLRLLQKSRALQTLQTEKSNRLGQFVPFINGCLDIKRLLTLNSTHIQLRNDLLEILYPWFEPVLQNEQHAPTSIAASLLRIEPSKNDPEPVQLTKDETLINVLHLVLHAHTFLASSLFTLLQRVATRPDLQPRLRDSQQQVRAFVSESLRCDPPQPLLAYAPRTDYDFSTHDAVYRVDEDSDLVVNVDAIHHDGRYYPDPDQFNMDRFLHVSEPILRKTTRPAVDHLAFGTGRRLCLGKGAAEELLVAVVSQVVERFDLRGGDVVQKEDVETNVWSWVGRSETQGAAIEFIKRS
ncbi:MAG: cytochrome P450 [Benjaminiella poitrasii]|nr:MAG: cytochrome P450 [Benjaminiella poitrasii]